MECKLWTTMSVKLNTIHVHFQEMCRASYFKVTYFRHTCRLQHSPHIKKMTMIIYTFVWVCEQAKWCSVMSQRDKSTDMCPPFHPGLTKASGPPPKITGILSQLKMRDMLHNEDTDRPDRQTDRTQTRYAPFQATCAGWRHRRLLREGAVKHPCPQCRQT